jgi:serine/threonine protein phosphatase PrpC
MTVLRAGSATDKGMVRSSNQDSVLAEAGAFAICDGMGGHAGGEIASAAAVASLRSSLATTVTAEGLLEAVRTANEAVIEAGGDNPDLVGMGTTAVVALLVATALGDRLLLANVGDSRAYHFHNRVLRQVTEDHSMVAELVREGRITEEEAAVHPQRHVITRVLGTAEEVDVDLFELNLAAGDRVLLCSDGLINELELEEVVRVLTIVADPTDAAEDLVRRANAHGGADNISVVVIDALVSEAGDEVDEHAPTVRSAPNGLEKGKESWLQRRRRLGMPRMITARVFGFVLLIAALVFGAIYFVRWYSDSQYYVTSEGNSIVIYQGHPGGVLWISPRKIETTKATVDQILPIRRAVLARDVTEPSLTAAHLYVTNLTDEFATSQPGAVTTTTTPQVP